MFVLFREILTLSFASCLNTWRQSGQSFCEYHVRIGFIRYYELGQAIQTEYAGSLKFSLLTDKNIGGDNDLYSERKRNV